MSDIKKLNLFSLEADVTLKTITPVRQISFWGPFTNNKYTPREEEAK